MKEKRMVKLIGDGSPIRAYKPDRNKICLCGSGKKQKKCCGDETRFYSTKPKPKPDMTDHIKKASKDKYPLTKI